MPQFDGANALNLILTDSIHTDINGLRWLNRGVNSNGDYIIEPQPETVAAGRNPYHGVQPTATITAGLAGQEAGDYVDSSDTETRWDFDGTNWVDSGTPDPDRGLLTGQSLPTPATVGKRTGDAFLANEFVTIPPTVTTPFRISGIRSNDGSETVTGSDQLWYVPGASQTPLDPDNWYKLTKRDLAAIYTSSAAAVGAGGGNAVTGGPFAASSGWQTLAAQALATNARYEIEVADPALGGGGGQTNFLVGHRSNGAQTLHVRFTVQYTSGALAGKVRLSEIRLRAGEATGSDTILTSNFEPVGSPFLDAPTTEKIYVDWIGNVLCIRFNNRTRYWAESGAERNAAGLGHLREGGGDFFVISAPIASYNQAGPVRFLTGATAPLTRIDATDEPRLTMLSVSPASVKPSGQVHIATLDDSKITGATFDPPDAATFSFSDGGIVADDIQASFTATVTDVDEGAVSDTTWISRGSAFPTTPAPEANDVHLLYDHVDSAVFGNGIYSFDGFNWAQKSPLSLTTGTADDTALKSFSFAVDALTLANGFITLPETPVNTDAILLQFRGNPTEFIDVDFTFDIGTNQIRFPTLVGSLVIGDRGQVLFVGAA